MPKRKSNPYEALRVQPLPLSSLDAALDLLVCETFSRLDSITNKFETCAGVKLHDGVVKTRWEEAVKRYFVMKSMDELTCGAKKLEMKEIEKDEEMKDDPGESKTDAKGRPLPSPYPGAIAVHAMNNEEEAEWRKWDPKRGDVVVVDTAEDGIWPGKIIEKKVFFQGRTVPRGNHFFPVRIYNEKIQPMIAVKSRLVPFHMRPDPPLLASPALLSAYHHAANPSTFDMLASARESLAAHNRLHPGVTGEDNKAKFRAEKDTWNKQVNWVMNERRIEKLRATAEERERRLREVVVSTTPRILEETTNSCADQAGQLFGCPKKRRPNIPDNFKDKTGPTLQISGPDTSFPMPRTPPRTGLPFVASLIKTSLSNSSRSNSPRRTPTRSNKRRSLTGLGELSPASRRTYTPPRILPSGDETAPLSFGGGLSLPPEVKGATFDFVSPLYPAKTDRLPLGMEDPNQPALSRPNMSRSGSLGIVREEEEEEGWTAVQRKDRRAGSEPLKHSKDQSEITDAKGANHEDMEL
ncbi:hypothetical protein L204_103784 [Cryptococcus depauperatus]|nr:hypothetical protein L204_02940 [Cryptococcus depauperatus CBS 7855]